MKRLTILLITTLSSCVLILPNNSTDNAFSNIYDTSIRLIIRHDEDSLYKTNYEQAYNLFGHYCKKIETTNHLDTIFNTGIAIRFWTTRVMDKKGTFYGAYPKRGLLDKVEKVKISFINETNKTEITSELKGDTNATDFIWKKYDYKKLGYGYYGSEGGCLYNPYFKDILSWIDVLNNSPSKLKNISNYDFIFWIDKQTINKLTFKPETLEIKITLIDTTGTKRRQLTDFVKIN